MVGWLDGWVVGWWGLVGGGEVVGGVVGGLRLWSSIGTCKAAKEHEGPPNNATRVPRVPRASQELRVLV